MTARAPIQVFVDFPLQALRTMWFPNNNIRRKNPDVKAKGQIRSGANRSWDEHGHDDRGSMYHSAECFSW